MTKPKPSPYSYKLFRVRLSDGRVTTVCIDPKLLARAQAPLGGVRPLNAWVRQTALSYTPDQGLRLSAFVAHHLRAELDKHSTAASEVRTPVTKPVSTKSRPAKLEATDDFRREFHHLLGRLAHAHANLDFNIGLQLNWLGPHLHVKVQHLLDARKVMFASRLGMLKDLVFERFENAAEAALDEFRQWFEAADAMKALRNDYVHGRWGVPGRVVDGRPMLTFMALHWDPTPDRPDDSAHMSLDEFASQVAKMEALAHDYFRLERKYLAYAKPAKLPSTASSASHPG